MPPATIILDNTVAEFRRSPAAVVHQDRADGTLPRHFAGSESGDRHRAERVLELGGAVVSVLDRSGREDVRLHQPRCHNASAVGLRGYIDHTLPRVAMHHHDLACA